MKTSKKERTRVIFLFVAIILLTAALLRSITDNVAEIIYNKKMLVELEETYEDLITNEASLKSEVTKLNDPDYVARYAKEKYLYSKDGEIIIRFE